MSRLVEKQFECAVNTTQLMCIDINLWGFVGEL